MHGVLRNLLLLAVLPGLILGARAEMKKVMYTGTGFVIHPDGYLLTCAHLIDYGGAEAITVNLDGRTYQASVLDFEIAHDIALLQIQAQKLTALPLANSNAVRLGEEVRAVGYPLQGMAGGGVKMTRGSIAGITTIGTLKTFQIDAPVNSGNSGGPIVNDRGEVVGIVNAKLTAEGVEGVGFAVPINYARGLLRNEFIDPPATERGEKLDGPALAERVTPAVAFLTVETLVLEEGDEIDAALPVAEVLQTKRLEIVDDAGTLLGVFGAQEGAPHITLFDTAGRTRAEFHVLKEESSLLLFDAKAKLRGAFVVMNGEPALALYDEKERNRGLFILENGTPALSLLDTGGKPRGRFLLKDEDAVMIINDADRPRLFVGLLDGNPSLVLSDTAGKERGWFLLENGKPNLSCFDAAGKATWHAP